MPPGVRGRAPLVTVASGIAGRAGPVNQMLNQVLEDRGVQLVANLLPAPLGDDETGVAQHREVARNRGPARVEPIRDVAGGQRAVPQQRENVAPRLVGQCAEGSIRRAHRPPLSCMISKLANYKRGGQAARNDESLPQRDQRIDRPEPEGSKHRRRQRHQEHAGSDVNER